MQMFIETLKGKVLDIEEYSLKRLFHYIPSLEIEHDTETVEGRDGEIFFNSRFSGRTITVTFLYESIDIQDFYLLRDEINALFGRKESFYIRFKKEPYKKYLVRLAKQFDMPPNETMGEFNVEFICVNVFGIAIADTTSPKTWDAGLWGWNGAITWDDDLRYTLNANKFYVINLGTAPIDPRSSELEITVKGTFPSSFTLTNVTTGDIYVYHKPLVASDTLVLKRVNSLKNGVSVFRDTNKRLISLASGKNQFVISGGTVSSITFNFKFLYL